MLIRKQARQPQARNASSGSRPAIENAPAASSSPPGTPMWAKLPKKPRRSRGGVLDGEQHGAAVLAADADALQDPQHDQGDRGPDADLVVRRQQADRGGADAHDQQGQDQHLLAADPVAEVAEDQPADRPGEEPDGEGGEGRELRGRSVQPVEVELVEDQAGGGAVEEEVVPLDGGADGRGDRDLARGRQRRRVVDVGGHRAVRASCRSASRSGRSALRWKTSGSEVSACVHGVQPQQDDGVVAGLDLAVDRAVEAGEARRRAWPRRRSVMLDVEPVEAVLDRSGQLAADLVVVVGEHGQAEVAGPAQHRPGLRGVGDRERHQRRARGSPT